jgi:hypothetical protein
LIWDKPIAIAEAVVNPDITEWLMKRISQPSLYIKEKYEMITIVRKNKHAKITYVCPALIKLRRQLIPRMKSLYNEK